MTNSSTPEALVEIERRVEELVAAGYLLSDQSWENIEQAEDFNCPFFLLERDRFNAARERGARLRPPGLIR